MDLPYCSDPLTSASLCGEISRGALTVHMNRFYGWCESILRLKDGAFGEGAAIETLWRREGDAIQEELEALCSDSGLLMDIMMARP